MKTGKCHIRDFPRQTSYHTTTFLDLLYGVYVKRQKKRKVIMIWDGAPWHRGKVKTYLKSNKWLELMYFPPYSPDLNPQEHIWKAGKQQVAHNSELPLEEKALRFYQYIATNRFPSNFMQKYFGTC